jgi:hypothetical protein
MITKYLGITHKKAKILSDADAGELQQKQGIST